MDENNVTPITRTGGAVQPSATPPTRFPHSVEEKVIVAKSIVMAVIAADQSGNLDGDNYDCVWPLRMVTELLEQAADQIDRERLEVGNG
jgi:hypothetical protein